MTRIIECQVSNEYVKGAGVVAGAAGSHHDVVLRLKFSEMWDGLTKSIVWHNAKGLNPVITLLTNAMRVDGQASVYDVTIPAEPKEFEGKMVMSIKGSTVSGSTETRATMAAKAEFIILPSKFDQEAAEAVDVNPTAAEQIIAMMPVMVAYGSTSYSEITEAIASGRPITAVDPSTGMTLPFSAASGSGYVFSGMAGNTRYSFTVSSSSVWSTTNQALTTADAFAPVQSASHSHSNKTVLDAISSAVKSGYDSLVTMLSGITSVVTTLGNDDTSVPTSKAVADAISFAGGGDMLKSSYDTTGTGNKVDTALNAEKLGGVAASSYHTGTLAVGKGGTGQTTAVNAANAFMNALSTGASAPTDADYYISQYAGGGTSTTTYHRRPHSALWTYIKGKADSVYAALSHIHAAGDITSGTLAVARGGTGNTSVDSTPTSGSTKMVTSGGVYTAFSNKLGRANNITDEGAVASKMVRAVYAGTADMTAGSTALTTGMIYLVYEA